MASTLTKLWDWPLYGCDLPSAERSSIRRCAEYTAAIFGTAIGLAVVTMTSLVFVIVPVSFGAAAVGYYVGRWYRIIKSPLRESILGERAYVRIRETLERNHLGKYVVFNLKTFEYVIGETLLDAADQSKKFGGAAYVRRIGFLDRV